MTLLSKNNNNELLGNNDLSLKDIKRIKARYCSSDQLTPPTTITADPTTSKTLLTTNTASTIPLTNGPISTTPLVTAATSTTPSDDYSTTTHNSTATPVTTSVRRTKKPKNKRRKKKKGFWKAIWKIWKKLGGSSKKAKQLGKRISGRVSRRRNKWRKKMRFGRSLKADNLPSSQFDSNPVLRRMANLSVKKRRNARSASSPPKKHPHVESRSDFGNRIGKKNYFKSSHVQKE